MATNINKSKTIVGTTPLHYATEKNQHKIIDALLINKARVDVVSRNKFTPLHHSASHCNQYEFTKK
ncbi:MAG: ankyrin repeat domain-containing protein [Candidatus Midichloria sp.]|nr:ankyrin repeat domain-containing protein [Candidatus Midichloria sp.]